LKGTEFLRDAALGKADKLSGKVIVIGGGNVAVDVALTARRLGSDDVTMVCLEKRDEMPAWDYEIEEALEEKVKIVNSLGPLRFYGDDQGRVNEVAFQECTAVFDENGRFAPQYDDCKLTSYETATVIVAIGQMGETGYAEKEGIALTAPGGFEADPVTLQTPIDWVFAGGDAFYGPKSVVDAIASGKTAAESIDRFINGEDLTLDREKNYEFEKPEITDVPVMERVEPEKITVDQREGNFKEVTLSLAREAIEREAARCLSCGICSECYQCVEACLAGAIEHEQQPEIRDIPVGSVIMTTGAETFDPSGLDDTYMYHRSQNVMTSLEFERILSAGGPTMGHLVRPSDEKEPEKIAWLQCIGSRDTNRCGNGYCSSVCCMYAIKDAMIAKEHSELELDAAIFNMDMRTFGKDYEKYYNRAAEQEGVRFVKSRIHSVVEEPGTDNLILKYADENGQMQEEVFDMVILSVGLTIPKESVDLAQRMGVDLDPYNFVKTHTFNPLETSRPGVYVSGTFQGPKDIPSSVTEASGSAGAAGVHLAPARHTLTKTVSMPEERDVLGEDPRVGVFVCKCGINIAGVIDVEEVEAYAKNLPNVVYTGENLFTCSQDSQESIKELIDEHQLNRVVVASCTPKTHEGIFMDTLEEAGLNKYLFEMANIRNQDSWMHFHRPEQATEKAKDLIRMAVARVSVLGPLHDKKISIIDKALVVGGGIAGMTAAKGLADQGFQVTLVEKEDALGGMGKRLHHTLEGDNIQAFVSDLVEKVEAHGKIDVLKQGLITDFGGYKGNFTTEVLVGDSMKAKKIDHGVMIVATGGTEYQPTEFLYPESDQVVTQVELADMMAQGKVDAPDRVIMIQCVGSRNEENPNCSRVCCQAAVKNAIALKKANPDTDVFILYRDMRTYALMEDYYTQARNMGVIFSRFSQDNPPQVAQAQDGKVSVTFTDHVLGQKVEAQADLVALSAGVRASDTEELSTIIKTQRNPEGFFMEAHVKLRPVDAATEGVFICGTAHGPKLITETVAQAMAAASRATTFLAQEFLTLSAVTAEVNQVNCASCLVCVRSCPYNVPV
ncbi:MAG: FAD-dependent oxidoreductase, partial [Desulfobacterales bacterium]|nr:FAD-dependent oxidoreductase [Desulfobacterales bacterium]